MELNLFINYDGDIDDIAEALSDICSFDPMQEKTDNADDVKYIFFAFDIRFAFHKNNIIENNGVIELSDYNYQLQMTKMHVAEKHKTYTETFNQIARFLTEKLAYDLGARTMLVENLSKVVFSAVPAVART